MLVGSTGNDVLDGGTGADTMFGGLGNDIYIVDNDGDRLLEAPGGGVDEVRSSVGYTLQAFVENGVLTGGASVYLGGNNLDNILTGNAGANELDGLDGNDTLYGAGGADLMHGGLGADHFVYRDASDSTLGAMDYLEYFEHGTDLIDLTAVAPTSLSFEKFDNPSMGYHWTTVTITTASGETMTIRVDGTATMADFILPAHPVPGTAGDDILQGTAGVDVIDGFDGNDLLIGGLGADALNGGAGIDTASYEDNQGAIFANLTLGQGFGNAAAGDTYSSIENVRGSVFDDTIIGDGGANRLEGGAGNDVLRGAIGSDTLIGGAGTDTASYEDNQGSVFVNLLTGQGFNNAAQGDSFDSIENLTGSIFADYFIGTNGVNILDGGAGNDTLLGGLGADMLIGGAGNDTASYEDNQGAVFVNLTLGQGFGNAAQGDIFSGIENLTGTVFYDTFIGDENANRLDGARGNDTLTGAGGADTFVFDTIFAANNIDTVTDFAHGVDHIELDDAIFAGLATGTPRPTPSRSAPQPPPRSISSTTPTPARSPYDADGSGAGAAIQFATLQAHLTITNTDFLVA